MSELVGKLTRLRASKESDVHELREIRNDVELQAAAMAIARGSSIKDVQAWLKKREKEEDTIFFVVADAKSDAVLGYVQLVGIRHGAGSLGILLGRKVHGKGHASEAMSLLEDHALSRGVQKVQLSVVSYNARAVAFYKKLGYSQTGTHPNAFERDDKTFDAILMEKRL